MKTLYRILFITAFYMLMCGIVVAQGTNTSSALVQEGIKLHDEGKYDEAIAKYQEALKADPENQNAQYEMAFSYSAQGKTKEAIPILEKIIKYGAGIRGGAYDMLGSAYDDEGQPQKAIDTYLAGLKNDPDYQRLYFNLGITHYRLNKYAEAEKWAIEALKREPNHASSHKLYAEVSYRQNKNLQAVIAFCNFLLLEPQTKRSENAMNYIDTIFKKSVSKNIYLAADKNGGISKIALAEMSLNLAASAKAELEKKGNSQPADLLSFELTMVFNAAGKTSNEIKAPKDFFWAFYADYFYKLSQTDNMPTFARYISLSSYGDDNKKWFKDNEAKLKAFSDWVQITKRSTE